MASDVYLFIFIYKEFNFRQIKFSLFSQLIRDQEELIAKHF